MSDTEWIGRVFCINYLSSTIVNDPLRGESVMDEVQTKAFQEAMMTAAKKMPSPGQYKVSMQHNWQHGCVEEDEDELVVRYFSTIKVEVTIERLNIDASNDQGGQ